MATERIDVVVSERGSKVVQRNLKDIGGAAVVSGGQVNALNRILGSIGIAAGVAGIIRMIDNYTHLQNRLRSTGLEGKNLKGVFDSLVKTANETRSSVDGTVELYSRLAISSKELGVSQQGLIDFTKSLNQAILLSGASAEEAQAGLIQLSQGMASGTLRGDELRSVLEQLPAVADVISQHMGVTRGQLRQMGQDGKITGKVILDAFAEARGELDERFAKTIPTIGQSLQVLKNHLLTTLGEFDKATGLSTAFSKALIFMAENIGTILKLLTSLAAGITLIGGGAAAINALRNAFVLLNAVIAANPIGFLLTVLTSAITALFMFRDQIKLGTNEVTTLGDYFRALGETVGAALSSMWQKAKALLGPLFALIQKWFGEVDFSIAGMLRLTAKAIDLFIGGFKGALNAVIAMFKGFGPAISDIVTSALNVVLGKIGDFVNGAGKLLSTVTEFAGLGKIATVNLQLSNENKGAAQKLGSDVGKAFKDGLAFSGAQDWLQGIFDRADEIAKKRIADEAAGAGAVSGVTPPGVPTPPGGDGKKGKKGKELIDQLKELVGQYDKVWAAQQELIKAEKLLDDAEKAGLITGTRKAEVLKMVKDQLKDQLDPLGAVNREMDKELELMKLTTDQREVESQARSIVLDLMQQGVYLSDTENTKLREKLQLIQDETKAWNARNAILDAIKGPHKQMVIDMQAIQDLIKSGAVSQQEANAYFVSQNADIMAGTIEARQADLFNLQQYYAQVDTWRQADVISATTAAKLKADAEMQYNMKRLDGASQFFSTLSGLSRSENRKLAAIGKAAAIASATIDGYRAVQAALVGPPGPPWSYAIAAATAAMTGANVAAIVNQPLPGFAFGGSGTVMGTGGTDSQTVSFRATPGEKVRVTTPSQEREEERRRAGESGSGSGGTRIINIIDPALVRDYMDTPEGEEVIINVMRRNQELFKQH